MKPPRTWVPIAAVVIAITPLVVATVRALSRGWTPIGDNGLILLRAEDVATANHPLLGTWTSASFTAGRNINNPGPLWFDVLAPFVRIGGPSVGLAVGVMVANIAAIVGAAWAAHRAGGVRASVLVTALSAGLAWAMGSELLFDAWQPHALILPFWALLVMCWGLAAGDRLMLPFVVGIASLLVQTHLTFVYVLTVSVSASVAMAAAGIARRASAAGGPLPPEQPSMRRVGVLTVGIAAVAWSQPLIDQFSGEANLADLAAGSGGDNERIGLGLGTRLVASVVALPPWWTRPGFSSTIRAFGVTADADGRTLAEREIPGSSPAVLGLLAVFAVLGVVILVGWRRRLGPVVVLGTLAGAAVVGALISMVLMPIGAVGISPHQMRWLWPISTLVLLAPAFAIAEWSPVRRFVVPVGLSLTGLAALANLPTHVAPEGPTADRGAGDTVSALVDQLSSYHPTGGVVFDVSTLRFAEPYSGPVIAALAREGVDVVVTDENMVRQLGPRRRADGDETRRLVLIEGPATRSPPLEARQVALVEGLDAAELAELESVRAEVLELARRDGLVLNEAGVAAAAAGRMNFQRTVLATGADPTALDDAGWITSLVADGYLALSPEQRTPFERYSELHRRSTTETVGLYELPLE